MYPIWLVDWAGELKVYMELGKHDAPACQTGASWGLANCEGEANEQSRLLFRFELLSHPSSAAVLY